MEEICLKGMLSLPFLKKERFTGSWKTMRYMICKEGEKIKAVVYPGPYCLEKTPEEKKEAAYFAFTPEGLEEATAWLNQRYREHFEQRG